MADQRAERGIFTHCRMCSRQDVILDENGYCSVCSRKPERAEDEGVRVIVDRGMYRWMLVTAFIVGGFVGFAFGVAVTL